MHFVPNDHPRAFSLRIREKLIEGMHKKIVAEAGLIAHGRGEAFDYLLGEKTPALALKQERAAVAALLLAKNPVISCNGNVASLCSKELVEFSTVSNVSIEINLFYRTKERERAIVQQLEAVGGKNILGVDSDYSVTIPEITHNRRIVDSRGIARADTVLVPLEDGDRTMALRKMGKLVISIDLNPLSRTSIWSNITIVNNVVRAIPEMIEITKKLNNLPVAELRNIAQFDNQLSLRESLKFMAERLYALAKEGGLQLPEI